MDLQNYILQNDIGEIILESRKSAAKHLKECASLEQYIALFRKYHKNFADASRHDPHHTREEGSGDLRILTLEQRRLNFQITLRGAAAACYMASILRQFTAHQDIIVAATNVKMGPRDLFLANGLQGPAPPILAKKFYLEYSGGYNTAILHPRILEWLPAVMEANDDEKGHEDEVIEALKKMFEPAPVSIQAAARAATTANKDIKPPAREDTTCDQVGYNTELPLQEANAA